MEKNHIIVGGGLAGLFSAKVLVDRGASNIYIVEKSLRIGGLLQHKTFENPLGNGKVFHFDAGTHFVLSPKNTPICELIKEDIQDKDYYSFSGSLQEGHVLNGHFYKESGCAQIQAFPKKIQTTIVEELKLLHQSNNARGIAPNLESEIHARYGRAAAEHIYKPAYHKFTGLNIDKLHVSMGNYFAPSRLIIEDRENSRHLKENADWDWRIAFADCKDGDSDIIKYYPKHGGIGTWLNNMAASLKRKGVKFFTQTSLEEIKTENYEIGSVRLSSGQTLACEQLIWSIPSIFLATLTNTIVPSQKPIMRRIHLVHFIIDKKPVERPHWITIYDKNFQSYRVTLYDNFAPSDNDAYKITVEIISDNLVEDTAFFENSIFEELKTMKIVDRNSKKLWSNYDSKAAGFPVLSSEHFDIYCKQNEILEKKYSNLSIVGRRPDTGGGQLAIMNYIWENLSTPLRRV